MTREKITIIHEGEYYQMPDMETPIFKAEIYRESKTNELILLVPQWVNVPPEFWVLAKPLTP